MTGVAEDLQLIILRGLSKEPAARYQNCAEMLRALEQVAVDDAQPTLTINRAELKRELRSATQSATGTLIAPGPRKMWLVIAICLAIGLGIALAAMLMMNGQMFGPREKHIAVLPFETNSQDPADQNVADGLMERITSQLSNLDAGKNSLWIVPSSEIRRLKIEDAKAASRELGATVAVAGRLQRTGKAITLLVDVIDAKSMRLLGSASLEQSLSGSTSVDQDAVQRIASILRVDMRSNFDEGNVLATQYENYLQGRALLQRFDKPGNRDEAIRLFQSVVSADPQFALGYASLGEAYWGKYRFDRNPEWLKRGAEYCNRAIQLNKKLPAVYTTLARIHDDSGNRDLALEEFDQALALDPRNADAHLGRASVYEAMGRYDDAENELKTAIDLRPEYWLGITELGSFYFRRNRVDDAMSAYRRVLDLVPDSASAHNNYGAVLSNNGRAKEAEAELRKSLQITENNYPAYANLGILYYRQKNWPEAARMTEKALQLNSSDYRVWGNLGISYEQMNDNEKAAAAYREELTRVEELAKFKSDDPFIQRELAVLYSKKKMRDEALRYLNAALARTPSDPRALTDAAEVYENLGDRTRALSFVQKAIAGGRTMDKLAENPGLRNVLSDPRLRKQ
jgi:serine/threonine-protein kinase